MSATEEHVDVLIGGGSPVGLSTALWSWQKLRRPLHMPRLAPGAPCPVSIATRPSSPDYSVPTLGRGPAYPLYTWRAGTLSFFYPVRPSQEWYPSAWSGEKVLRIVAPRYRGPVLIRGRQLDGPNLVRFDDGSLPSAELQIPAGGVTSSVGFRNRASSTRLRAAGCYAWQVDGTTFSRVIVFRAVVIRD
jgi:hypothetical protein